MKTSNHIVIMAGGIGSRFWPISTSDCPKQFIDVLGCGKSLLQLTLERFGNMFPKENVWIVTSAAYADMVMEQLPDVPKENILLEPCRRNTAPCIAYAAWKIKKKDPNANMVVTPSDHFVQDVTEFRRVIESSLKFVSDSDAILTLGIKPTRPETGYGYIEAVLGTSSLANKEVYRVDSFKEKPDIDVAKAYIARNNFYWNSGIFIWNVQTIVNAFRVYQSPIANIFESILPVMYTEQEQSVIDEKFPDCRNISVDYAILERAEEVFVFPVDFGWSDLGTWMSLYDRSSRDLNGNSMIGCNVEFSESHNCIVHAKENKRIVLIGINDCIVAEHDGNLLVCKMSEEGRIKEFTDK